PVITVNDWRGIATEMFFRLCWRAPVTVMRSVGMGIFHFSAPPRDGGWQRHARLAGMRIVVAGGAGFLGSHFCDRLIAEGHTVVCLDNLVTGSEANLAGLRREPRFSFEPQDICDTFAVAGPVDAVT